MLKIIKVNNNINLYILFKNYFAIKLQLIFKKI